jgi:tripartite-type tricarboxylate transporter receptor subunit TctC
MKLPRRQFLHLAAGAAALPAVSRSARAQAYPARPVRIIVGFAPGGATDIMARLMGHSLSERLGQQFVIENRPGAASNVGTEAVVNAAPERYTLLLANGASAVSATLYEKLSFDFIRDIAPVASIGGALYVMVINPSFPAKTVPEFIAYAKANPGKINMGSSGSGSVSHVFGERFIAEVASAAMDIVGPPLSDEEVAAIVGGERSETAVSATVLQAERDQHEGGQLEPILPGKSVPRHICYELIYNHAQ